MTDILKIDKIVIHYETDDGVVAAVNGVTLCVKTGKTLGLVGETGAGKTTLAKGIIGLLPKNTGRIKQGKIEYNGEDLLLLTENELQKIRGKHISMIFQDPMTSLNPIMPIGEQIAEVIENHENISSKEAMKKARSMLELVGIPAERSGEYPHQFSGGMKQRVIIAISLACNPKLLIADEPTTALDVTIQAQVLETIKNLKNKFNTSMLLITHDLGVVAQNCDEVAIIYAGEIVEYGSISEIYHNTKHPYTIGLFGSIPSLSNDVERLKPIPGLMPDPMNLPKGCKFWPRCECATEKCKEKTPDIIDIGDEHTVKCFLFEQPVEQAKREEDADEK